MAIAHTRTHTCVPTQPTGLGYVFHLSALLLPCYVIYFPFLFHGCRLAPSHSLFLTNQTKRKTTRKAQQHHFLKVFAISLTNSYRSSFFDIQLSRRHSLALFVLVLQHSLLSPSGAVPGRLLFFQPDEAYKKQQQHQGKGKQQKPNTQNLHSIPYVSTWCPEPTTTSYVVPLYPGRLPPAPRSR